ncbi:uncharacterized protein LOC133203254 [Saccostrea echinata]|uniref:uncharacterized protein LOC133203254 n=1 Tax=Saccostrea echinata TaxID=191078 RepID=UPI002A80284E|nr:uncharacterized protein LOC133203254 [Saccostrea echinata]
MFRERGKFFTERTPTLPAGDLHTEPPSRQLRNKERLPEEMCVTPEIEKVVDTQHAGPMSICTLRKTKLNAAMAVALDKELSKLIDKGVVEKVSHSADVFQRPKKMFLSLVDDCKTSTEGLGYRGRKSVTSTGKTCQRWDSQTPHSHDYADLLPGNASKHENYCRNPLAENVDGPWCYTTDDDTRWELCYIPFCECRETMKGVEYRGTMSQTMEGYDCQRWDSLVLPDSYYAKQLEGNISEHENYCRNPGNSEDLGKLPWCFTSVPDVPWGYCNIPFCSKSNAECLNDEKGVKYFGTKSTTKDGLTCQRWDVLEPHWHSFSKGFMGLNASEHENYCRNPEEDEMPWCYTVNSTIPFQYCDIRLCKEKDCKDTENGVGYRGKRDTTRDGILCQRWDRNTPHRPHGTINFPGSSLSAQENYCRNPQNDISPWCYTTDPNIRWQYCDIPFCLNSKNIYIHVLIVPFSTTSLVEVGIRLIDIQEKTCQDCFACLHDGLCIEREGFCDMNLDCPDSTDEENCALECYYENVYKGYRKETKYLHRCMEGAENTCRFDESKEKLGCFVNSEQRWEECNVPKCDTGFLDCKFENDLCGWKQMQHGIKWNRQIAENTGEMFALAESKLHLNEDMEERAVLYSTPQPSSSSFGCITISYSGINVSLNVFITQGTTITSDKIVFQHQIIELKSFAIATFQTPFGTPYMVVIVAKFQAISPGFLKLEKISHENGICKDKGPCDKTEFQCDDGSCVHVDKVCNRKNNCPNNEDEFMCRYNSSECVQMKNECILPCPSQCECQGVIFRCHSPENIPKEVKVLDFSLSSFDTRKLRNFSFLLHLNISGCSINDSTVKNLGYQLRSSNLQNLDLSFNNLRHLNQNTFGGMINLLYLNISHNQIESFEILLMSSIPKLRYLNLRNNKIEIIQANEMGNIFYPKLKYLDLRNNKIRTIMPKSLYLLGSITKLILSHNTITNTEQYFTNSMRTLSDLDLSSNLIKVITNNMFSGLSRLRDLNLKNNQIEILNGFSFSSLISLRTLNLAFNKIHTIHRKALENMVLLSTLNLTGNRLRILDSARFVALIKLQILDLSHNGIYYLNYNTFQRLEEVKYLYIHGNNLSVSKTMFQGLCNLEWMSTDSYIICCAKPLSVDASKCISPQDRISSCEQLINVRFLAQMIWYMALFSLVGNSYVIYYRIRSSEEGSTLSQGIFILNLSFSDLLMGIYLFIIALADMEYRNVYGFHDSQWRSSITCTVAGLLAMLSSETSVLFVFLITVERYLALRYPFTAGLKRRKKEILGVTIIVWLFGIIFATLPILFYHDFYSRSTVCISLPLTTERLEGWKYSTFGFIGFNILIFMAILIGQILIFIEVRKTGKALNNDNTRREIAVLRSLTYVVLSDTFCWIPIILIGIAAYAGLEISFDIYAWVIVLVLPINSALNPIIYTFSLIYKQKQQRQIRHNHI